MGGERIRHTVVFTLVHPGGSEGERDFLEAAEPLATIPGVEISMEFADRPAYERYNDHPAHVRFVQDRWLSDVSYFLELDYAAR